MERVEHEAGRLIIETDTTATVGERLRAAREKQKMTLEAVAATTRIPIRHLASLEAGEWASLPAPTYCIGFAKNYAAIVGLDRAEIATDLRAEMGGTRQIYTQAEVFQPADPKRIMPKWLIFGALLGVILVVAAMTIIRQRSLAPAEVMPVESATPAPAVATAIPTPALVPATGPVTVTALQDAWIKVRERGGATLRESLLKQGESYSVPTTATAPLLDTGRPEALQISVGGRNVPTVGNPGRSVSGVSLLPVDLARGTALAPPAQ